MLTFYEGIDFGTVQTKEEGKEKTGFYINLYVKSSRLDEN